MQPSNPDYPRPTSKNVTTVMKSNKRSDTKPEVSIRSCLHRIGLRFRKDFTVKVDGRNCRPDIVFTRAKLAVFIDGCFWHFCPEHGHIPKSNTHYWEPKLMRNRERDIADTNLLQKNGWHVLRIWEHVAIQDAADIIVAKLSEINK